MHNVDLSKFDLRTDLIIEKDITNIKNNYYTDEDIEISDIVLENDDKSLGKKKGKYVTISFQDITDTNHFSRVLDVLEKELKKMYTFCKIKSSDTCLIIGLGNPNIICDALGSKSLSDIIITRHMFLLDNVDKKYRNVAILEPNVIGVTGVDSFEIIKSVIQEVKPNFVICIDSLCAIKIERLNKTIQITSTGITPGSGIGNNKEELSFDTLGVPVLAIGIPTVVDSTVIVSDTIHYLLKKISYMKHHVNNNLDKLKHPLRINYLKGKEELSKDEKKELLGYIGLLNNNELKSLIWEVLSPIDANMIVTTKEIDFIIDKLSKLISSALNKSLHRF